MGRSFKQYSVKKHLNRKYRRGGMNLFGNDTKEQEKEAVPDNNDTKKEEEKESDLDNNNKKVEEEEKEEVLVKEEKKEKVIDNDTKLSSWNSWGLKDRFNALFTKSNVCPPDCTPNTDKKPTVIGSGTSQKRKKGKKRGSKTKRMKLEKVQTKKVKRKL